VLNQFGIDLRPILEESGYFPSTHIKNNVIVIATFLVSYLSYCEIKTS